MKIHPAAALLPRMSAEEYDALVESIRKHGQQQEVIVRNGEILDGRHRFEACKQLGIVPKVREWKGQCGTPIDFVLAQNLERRHLSSSQRAAVAADALAMFEAEAKKRKTGRPAKSPGKVATTSKPERRARDDAASAFKTSPRQVQDAKKLKAEAPDLFEQVRSGDTTIGAAKREVAKREQAEMAATLDRAIPADGKQKLARLALMSTLAKTLTKVGALVELDAEACAAAAEDDDEEDVARAVARINDWHERFTSARRRRNLKSVRGGKS